MNDFEKLVMEKFDIVIENQGEQNARIAVNTNDIAALKGSKSWLVNLASAVGAGGVVAWFTKG